MILNQRRTNAFSTSMCTENKTIQFRMPKKRSGYFWFFVSGKVLWVYIYDEPVCKCIGLEEQTMNLK